MSEETEPASPKFSWTTVLGQVGAVSALVVGWLFLTGWSYAYFYFAGFGIGVSGLSLDPGQLPVWGLVAIKEVWWQVLLGAAALFVLGAAATRYGLRTDLMLGLMAILAAAVFAAGFEIGRQKADRDLAYFPHQGWPGFERVVVHMRPGIAVAGSPSARAQADLSDGCHRLIFQDRNSVFVFRPLAGKPGLGAPVTVLNRGDIAILRISPGTKKKQPLCVR